MEPTESQLRRLKTAYKKGHRYALIKMGYDTIKCTSADIDHLTKLQDEKPNVYEIEDIYILIN